MGWFLLIWFDMVSGARNIEKKNHDLNKTRSCQTKSKLLQSLTAVSMTELQRQFCSFGAELLAECQKIGLKSVCLIGNKGTEGNLEAKLNKTKRSAMILTLIIVLKISAPRESGRTIDETKGNTKFAPTIISMTRQSTELISLWNRIGISRCVACIWFCSYKWNKDLLKSSGPSSNKFLNYKRLYRHGYWY